MSYCGISGCYDNGRWLILAGSERVKTCSGHISTGVEGLNATVATVVDLADEEENED